MPLTFSNPRDSLTVPEWPVANERAKAIFVTQPVTNGLYKVTRHLNGHTRSSPSGRPIKIVDGSDGLTYIIGAKYSGKRFYVPGTMKGVIYVRDEEPLFDAIGLALNLR